MPCPACNDADTPRAPARLQDRVRRGRLATLSGWDTKFQDPVPGCVTLRDAAEYIQQLPKAEQRKEHWQTAVHVLIMAAEGKGPVMFARIGMLKAIHYGEPVVFSGRKETHWGKRKLKRDQ